MLLPQTPFTDHPDEGRLLLLIEGELSSEEASEVQAHLHHCWDCRGKTQKFQNGIYAFVDYSQTTFLPGVGEPPNGWREFDGLLDHASSAPESQPPGRPWYRLARKALVPRLEGHRRPLVFAALAAALFTLLVLWPVAAPPVLSAGQFLDHARGSRKTLANRAQGKPLLQRVRIRIGRRSVVRDVIHTTAGVARASRETVPRADDAEAQSAFQVARLDWSDPLNPDRYSAWHESLAATSDRVSRRNGAITLTTSTRGGSIREASLTVDAADWHPTDEQFQLTNGTEIEISELSLGIVTPQPTAGSLSRDTNPAREETHIQVSLQEFLAAEVEVRVVLHELGADLGEPWEIHRSPDGGVIVDGALGSREKLDLAQERLARNPHVAMHLQPALPTLPGFSASDAASTLSIASTPVEPLLREQLRSAFPDFGARTVYINSVLSESDSQLVRALAVKQLADRYTPAVLAEMDEVAKRKLQRILDDHIDVLRHRTALLGAILGTLVDLSAESSRVSVRNWQEQAEAALQSIETIDQLCTALFVGGPHAGDTAQSRSRLREQFAALRSTLDLPYRLDGNQ